LISRRATRAARAVVDRQDSLAERVAKLGRVETLATIELNGRALPVHGFSFGPADPSLPVLLVVGGVHGVERIGAEVALASLEVLLSRLSWDRMAQWQVENCRMLFVPLLNPGGVLLEQRGNPNGVDLMRNAPTTGEGWSTPFVGGQRFSPRLPWYRGPAGAPMELESDALVRFFEQVVLPSRRIISLDVHSGFGMRDRLWFPYARTRKPFPGLPEVYELEKLLDRTLANHVYKFEPQATVYTTQGDLWDYLYDRWRGDGDGVFLPLTLEMGSWAWVRKKPSQLITIGGSFNPMVPHRVRRILRRHLLLIEFLHRAVFNMDGWMGSAPGEKNPGGEATGKDERFRRAFQRYYG
jgi:hypothetical protein